MQTRCKRRARLSTSISVIGALAIDAHAAVVLERAQRLEVRERTRDGAAHCVAEFEGGDRTVSAHGESLRIALLRAFVISRFGDTVDEVLRQPQALFGTRATTIGEQSPAGIENDQPKPDGEIGDIQSAPR